MSVLAKSALQPVATPHESLPNLSVLVPAVEEPSRALVPLICMLTTCAAFVGSFAFLVLIPAIKTLMGT